LNQHIEFLASGDLNESKIQEKSHVDLTQLEVNGNIGYYTVKKQPDTCSIR